MRKIKNSKGFTLMEMLIVVAIIAVLIAIAIPSFNSSLSKAYLATDQANIRAGYAAVMTEALTDTSVQNNDSYTLLENGKVVKGTPTDGNTAYATKAAGTNVDIAGYKVTWKKDKAVTYTVNINENNVVSVTIQPAT